MAALKLQVKPAPAKKKPQRNKVVKKKVIPARNKVGELRISDYRVTHLAGGKYLPLTWIWDVLPSCLGSSGPPAVRTKSTGGYYRPDGSPCLYLRAMYLL